MDEFGLTNKDEVKKWYDGFTIGNLRDIYNPWSIICFLDKRQLKTYWANTSSNGLAGGYLKVVDIEADTVGDIYTLELTNYEVQRMMVLFWSLKYIIPKRNFRLKRQCRRRLNR